MLFEMPERKKSEMLTWTNQDLHNFCEQAVLLLNKKRQLQLEVINCWLFSNSAGGNFHIYYYNKFLDKYFELCLNSKLLQKETFYIDETAKLEKIAGTKLKIVLRIAYFIYKDCQKEMEITN